MLHKIIHSFLVLILVFGSIALPENQVALAAGPWYVSPTGDNNNNCLSPASPCGTINGAVGKASSGDTVYVSIGTYTGSGDQVVLLDRDITLSGGWDGSFNAVNDLSIVDGEHLRKGILVNDGVTAVVEGFTIQNGSAIQGGGISLSGGGVYNGGTLTMNNVVITGNTAQNGGGIANGGGNSSSIGNLTLMNTWIDGNSAGDAGGGIYNFLGTLIANNTSITNNTTRDAGGGIMNYCCSGPNGGTVILNDSTVSSNSAGRGGGISNAGSFTANSSTIAGNNFSGNFGFGSGGIDNGYGGTAMLKNSILASNTSSSTIPGPDCAGPINSSGYNIVGNSSGCTFNSSAGDLINVDAKLGAVIGSPAYHPLFAESPAVDGGNPAGCTDQDGNLLTSDQRNAARVGNCDIGAYEYTVPGTVNRLSIRSGNHQQSITTVPFSKPLQVAALDSQGSPVEGVAVDFTAPASGPSGTFADTGSGTTSAISDVNGIATTSVFTANDQAGSYTVSASAAGTASANFNLEQLGRPDNDDFANAEVINSLPFNTSVDNTNATLETAEPQNCGVSGRTVWYAFTPVEAINIRLEALVDNDILNIYHATGPGLAGLQFLECIGTGDYTTIQAAAGETYYFQASRFFNEGGSIQFNLRQALPPANDVFANAEAIPSLPFNTIPDLTDTGVEPGEPQACGFSRHSVWYSFTPADTISVKAQVQSVTGFMAVYQSTGAGISDLQPIQSASCITSNFPAIFLAEAGQTYYLQAGISPGNPTDIHLDLQQVIPPPNDTFASAESVASIPFDTTVDVTNAWTEPNEPQYCAGMNRTVWYAFTPEQTVAVRANTLGSTTSANLNVYQPFGAGIANMNFIGCTTSSGGTFSFVAQAGQTYYLQVGIDTNDPATIQVHLQLAFPPANDNLADAEAISALPFSAPVDITDATNETGEPLFYCYYMPRTAWYSFTPSETMMLRASTVGSPINGNVNIYVASGSGFPDLQFLNCSGTNSAPSFLAEAGKTYYFQVGSAFGETGTVKLNLWQAIPPANDNFSDAVNITSQPFHSTVDLIDATVEAGEPQICYGATNTAWYSFNAPETKRFRADTLGGPSGGSVNIYHATGAGISDLQFLQCAGPGSSPIFTAQAGETYYFQVASVGQPGSLQFNLAEVTAITGRVTDAVSGAPLPGNNEPFASVYLYRICGDACQESVNSQTTDSLGNFSFDSDGSGNPLPAGSYQITATATLYAIKQFGPFEFTGSNLAVGDLALSPPSTIGGRIVDAKTGEPIPSDYVELFRCDSGVCEQYINSQFTDSEGRFQFDRFYDGSPLTAGNYELGVSGNPFYQAKRVPVTVGDGEILNLGDVPVDPMPLLDSISGRMIDAVTGKPVLPVFTPQVSIYRCEGGEDNCFFVNSTIPGSDGRFRFETDYSGNRLIVGSYRVYANADQYFTAQADALNVAENENRNLGSINITSVPVRFSELQSCSDIPAGGGDCTFSIRVSNGMDKSLSGKVWSMTDAMLPETFARYTNFQVSDAQDLDLGKGNSKVFSFKFRVPANLGSYGTFICTRIYVGQGPQAQLNTIGFRYLFCVMRNAGGFTIASPDQAAAAITALAPASAAVTGTEVEPNNSCQSAQDVGALSGPFIMPGNLDSSVSPDVDFFHFTGTPGQPLVIDLEGWANNKGTLFNPYLGVFDSDCNLMAANDDSGSLNSRLEINIPANGSLIVAATSCCDYGFQGGDAGTYQLTVAPVETIGSVRGVITDAANGRSLRGDVAPFAFVRLLRNGPNGFNDVSAGFADSDGSFNFATDTNGNPLVTGDYMIIASAEQYQPTQTDPFSVGRDENYNAGSVALESYPVRFSDLQTCSVPSDGGQCDFSVKITNGLTTKFSGRSWSTIDASYLGTFAGSSSFQAGALQDVSLNPGKSMVLKFRFQVRGSVPDGATMCASTFVGQNPSPLFNPVGLDYLFCIVKGSGGFTLTLPQETQAQMHQMEIQEEIGPDPNFR